MSSQVFLLIISKLINTMNHLIGNPYLRVENGNELCQSLSNPQEIGPYISSRDTRNSNNNTSTIFVRDAFVQEECGWWSSVLGSDGSIYGIPADARRVAKFNPFNLEMTLIGPDLGDCRNKFYSGVLFPDNGCIYCAPFNAHSMLKIDTIHGNVTPILLPAKMQFSKWRTGALAIDGCIYFMPYSAKHILKVNPADDSVSSIRVGYYIGEGCKYWTTIAGSDGCIYGIPYTTKIILKYDPVKNEVSWVGKVSKRDFVCFGGALGRDGNIYAANNRGQILMIDIYNDDYRFLTTYVKSDHQRDGWADGILGGDGCIYWPPCNASFVLKFDPSKKEAELVGERMGTSTWKWFGGAMATNGFIYCIPNRAKKVLVINTPTRSMKELGDLVRLGTAESRTRKILIKYGLENLFEN